MAIEKRKIENLKPGKKYALNVKVKNTDLNIVSDLSDTIIFTVPTDTTIPSALTNLELFAGLENVMFVFDYSEDLDIRKYEYELYQNSDMSDETGPRTGFADANIFTVSVNNLQLEEDGGGLARFWGRARAIDTTGNAGPWTSLVETDDRIPLIDNQYIGSLTASKITSGTIDSHTITLNSASSIIKSSTFNGTLQGNGSYSFPNGGGQGWLINGQGKAYFYDATIVGSIDIGGFDSGSFHVDTEGNMWLGAGVYGEAPFRVSKEGVLQINQTDFDDIVEGIIDFNERNNRNPTTPATPTLANTITAGSFNIGSSYKIVSLTGTSQAQWNTAAGTAGITYAIGSVFTAAGAGAGTGTVSGETIDHDINDDGSVDISFEWNYPITIVAATSIVSGTKYQIVSPGNTSFTAIGADNNNVDTIFTANGVVATSLTSLLIGTGSKVFTITSNSGIATGQRVRAANTVTPANYMEGTVTVSGTTMTMTVDAIGGSGTFASWSIKVVPTGTGTVSVYSLERDIDGFYVHIHSSSLVTAGSFVVGRSYRIISLGDTTNAQWVTAGVSGTAAIGTVFTAAQAGTGTGTVAQVYTMGTSPALESTYPLRSEERAAIYRGLASNKFYTFGVRAFRIVDTDIDSDGIIYGDFAQSTVVEENPYRPADNVAFKGDIEGTINGEDIALIIGYATAGNTTAGNFNTRNDRNSTTPTAPTLASTISSSNLNIGSTYKIVFAGSTNWNTAAGTNGVTYQAGSVFEAKAVASGTGTVSGETIDHDINDDGSVDISFEWNYTVSETPSAANNIDGFAIYCYTSPTLDISAVTPSSPSAGSVTYTTLAPHGFAVGNTVVISDLVPVGYNGTFTVTAVTSTTFRVANSTTATVTNAVGSVFGNTAYTIGASPSNELVYFLPREKRALILQAVPSNKFYTFGVKAYRIVDTNLVLPDTTVATSGILYSAAVQSAVTEENPYQPSTTVAFKGDVTGTINQVDVVDITTTYNNFNSDNDRFDTIPASATGVTFTSPNANFDGSINLTMDWVYPDPIFSAGSFVAGAKYNIISLGTTTQAQWNTIAGTSGISYIIGSTFTASSGAQVGTGTAIKHANSIDGFAIYLRAKDTILVTAITTGTVYKIVSLGNTTTAQWNTVGVSGTAVVGTVFTASSGTRVGDGRVIENTQANITDSDFNASNITVFYLTPEKSAITFPPLASDKLYRAAIRAYRMVDTDINSTGIIYGSLVNTTADYHKGLPIIGGDTGITIGNGKIYIGIGNYNNTDTGFYVDSTSKFSLKDKLSWDGSTLSVTGTLKFSDGVTPGRFNNGDTLDAGTIAGLTINATKMFFGTGTFGNDNTPFHINNAGAFSLGSGLKWGNLITAGAFVAGKNYRIVSVGTTTNWNTVAGTSGATYIAGTTFTAAVPGTGNGTAALLELQLGGSSTIGTGTLLSDIEQSVIDFDGRNNRNSTALTNPATPSGGNAIDHTVNTDSSADISFEWTYAYSDADDAAGNIDGFYVHVHSSSLVTAGSFVPSISYRIISAGNTSFTLFGAANNNVGTVFTATGNGAGTGTVAEVYTIGSRPNEEATYPVSYLQRAAIFTGLPINKFYTFGVRAFRVVDTNLVLPDTTVATSGMMYSSFAQSTSVIAEHPYRPSPTTAFQGNITGTIGDLSAATIAAGTNNFNANNDSKSTIPATPTSVVLSSAVINTNGGIDLGLTWQYTSSPVSITNTYYDPNTGAHTYVTATPHGFSANDIVQITGIALSSYNYTGVITGVGSTSFYFAYKNNNPRSALAQGTTTFTVAGTSQPSVIAAATYTVVTQSSSNYGGSGAVFTIQKTGSGTAYSGNITVTITAGGSGYAVGDTITIPGASLGGVTGTNDLVLLVATKADGLYSSGGSVSSPDAYDIDGFTVFLRTTAESNASNILNTDLANTDIQQVYLTAEKRSHTFSGISPTSYYRAAVRPYRKVYTTVATSGIIYGSLVNTAQRTATSSTLGGTLTLGSTSIYFGTGSFNNNNTPFYVNNAGALSLGSGLKWGDFKNATEIVSGKSYRIISVGTTTNWNTIAGTSGVTYIAGNTITAVANGSGNGTAALLELSITGTVTAAAGFIGGWTIGSVTGTANSITTTFPGSIYKVNEVGGVTTLSLMSPDGSAWFSAGVLTSSVAGFGAPVTTGGAISRITTPIAGGFTRGFLRNISYGTNEEKPSSPVLGDIHFSS